MSNNRRARLWTTIAYPESAPDNWREILDDMKLEWIESPLHDKDINADGAPKKAHWHLMFIFEGVKAYDQIREICGLINATTPQIVQNGRSMVRYMVHFDNPEKYQYDPRYIVSHGGADVDSFLKSGYSERYAIIAEMIDYCETYDIQEFSDLLVIARETAYSTWYPILCDSAAFVMGNYLKSRRHKKDKENT